jgi:hypothetical protein
MTSSTRDGTVKPMSRAADLPPLRWVAEERLLYDRAANELHRWSCRRAPAISEELERGDALSLVWAPRMCRWRPDVTLGLGHDRSPK